MSYARAYGIRNCCASDRLTAIDAIHCLARWQICGRSRVAPRRSRIEPGAHRHAAVELADADGLGALSMARLAERLGCGTMSLYRHVANKDELVMFMLSTAPGPPPAPAVPPTGVRALLIGPPACGTSTTATPGSWREAGVMATSRLSFRDGAKPDPESEEPTASASGFRVRAYARPGMTPGSTPPWLARRCAPGLAKLRWYRAGAATALPVVEQHDLHGLRGEPAPTRPACR